MEKFEDFKSNTSSQEINPTRIVILEVLSFFVENVCICANMEYILDPGLRDVQSQPIKWKRNHNVIAISFSCNKIQFVS